MFHRSKSFPLCLHTFVYYSMSGCSGGHLSWCCLGIFLLWAQVHTNYECVLNHVQLCGPINCSPPSSSVHGIFQARNTGAGHHFLLQAIFPPGIEPASLVSPALAGGFFTTSATWEAPYWLSRHNQFYGDFSLKEWDLLRSHVSLRLFFPITAALKKKKNPLVDTLSTRIWF